MQNFLNNVYYLSFYRRPKRTLNSKKYGVDLIRYTHAVNTALHCSTKVDGKTKTFLFDRIICHWSFDDSSNYLGYKRKPILFFIIINQVTNSKLALVGYLSGKYFDWDFLAFGWDIALYIYYFCVCWFIFK